MGLIARILDSFKGDDGEPAAKVEVYKGDNITARIFNPPGVDARPLDQDICFTEDSEDTEGGKDILGFIDQKNEPVAEKGEHRTYARDADGVIVAIIHLKKNGSVEITGLVGDSKQHKISMNADGSLFINTKDATLHLKNGLTEIVNVLLGIGLGTALDELITEIQNLTTFGSPTAHKVTDGSKALIETKLQQLLTVIGG